MCPGYKRYNVRTHIGIGDSKKFFTYKDKLSPLLVDISESILMICSV